jgi:hypothetical protein
MLTGMTIGTSLVLIAAGAILHYAVTAHVSGVDIQTVGTILMIVGILGLIISLLFMLQRERPAETRVVERERRPDPYA